MACDAVSIVARQPVLLHIISIIVVLLGPTCAPRRTKRHISEEINEWEEEHNAAEGGDKHMDPGDLDWGFMDDKDSQKPVASGYAWFVSFF